MNQEKIILPTLDGECEAIAFYSGPEAKSKAPLLIYMDAFGVRPALHAIALKLAEAGHFVLVPNLFYRKAKLPVLTGLPDKLEPADLPTYRAQIMQLIPSLTPELLLRDAQAYLQFIRSHPTASTAPVGIIGYCFGGAHALRTAAEFSDNIGAVASFHAGNLASESPQSPHLLLSEIKAELYFGHADHDKSMPAEQIERLEEALKKNHNRYLSEVYPGAHHGFTMADLPAYDQNAFEIHLLRITSLMDAIPGEISYTPVHDK